VSLLLQYDLGAATQEMNQTKIPAINSKYGAAIQSQVFRSMFSRTLQNSTTQRFLSPWQKFTIQDTV